MLASGLPQSHEQNPDGAATQRRSLLWTHVVSTTKIVALSPRYSTIQLRASPQAAQEWGSSTHRSVLSVGSVEQTQTFAPPPWSNIFVLLTRCLRNTWPVPPLWNADRPSKPRPAPYRHCRDNMSTIERLRHAFAEYTAPPNSTFHDIWLPPSSLHSTSWTHISPGDYPSIFRHTAWPNYYPPRNWKERKKYTRYQNTNVRYSPYTVKRIESFTQIHFMREKRKSTRLLHVTKRGQTRRRPCTDRQRRRRGGRRHRRREPRGLCCSLLTNGHNNKCKKQPDVNKLCEP